MRIFLCFCRNRFGIGLLHYILSSSDFVFEFAEIFVIEKQLADSASRGVADSPTQRVGESSILRLAESGSRWLSSPLEGKKSFMIKETCFRKIKFLQLILLFIKIFFKPSLLIVFFLGKEVVYLVAKLCYRRKKKVLNVFFRNSSQIVRSRDIEGAITPLSTKSFTG